MVSMKYLLPLSILMLGIAGHALASDLELTASEIKARIIGNTISGVDDGETYMEYYSPNGTILGTDSSGKYTGNWRIDGDQLCTLFPDDDDSDDDNSTDNSAGANKTNNAGGAKSWSCSNIGLIGDKVIWNDDGDLSDAKLLPGHR